MNKDKKNQSNMRLSRDKASDYRDRIAFANSTFAFSRSYDYAPKNNTNFNEYAFYGRSNVGKSSAINNMLKSNIALTSKEPGRTRKINFFKTTVIRSRKSIQKNIAQEDIQGIPTSDDYIAKKESSDIYIVDLPGYGHANTSRSVSELWPEMIGDYINSSKNLKIMFLLIDIRRSFMQIDFDVLNILMNAGIFVQIIVTKRDKIPFRVEEFGVLLGKDRMNVANYFHEYSSRYPDLFENAIFVGFDSKDSSFVQIAEKIASIEFDNSY